MKRLLARLQRQNGQQLQDDNNGETNDNDDENDLTNKLALNSQNDK